MIAEREVNYFDTELFSLNHESVNYGPPYFIQTCKLQGIHKDNISYKSQWIEKYVDIFTNWGVAIEHF